MPIIKTIDDDEPLSQGDVLSGVKLFGSVIDAGELVEYQSDLSCCLLLSRPCIYTHKDTITVAGVQEFFGLREFFIDKKKKSQTEGDTTDEAMKFGRFLEEIRDGSVAPDVFYLGELPGATKKYAARFEAIFNLKISAELHSKFSKLKSQLPNIRREGRLTTEFLHDLQLRLFSAHAKQGFSDLEWMSNDDLKALKVFYDKDLATINSKDIEHAINGNQKARNNLSPTIEKLEGKIALISNELARRTPQTTTIEQPKCDFEDRHKTTS